MPIGWLYITYHLLREPETAIESMSMKSSFDAIWWFIQICWHSQHLPCQWPGFRSSFNEYWFHPKASKFSENSAQFGRFMILWSWPYQATLSVFFPGKRKKGLLKIRWFNHHGLLCNPDSGVLTPSFTGHLVLGEPTLKSRGAEPEDTWFAAEESEPERMLDPVFMPRPPKHFHKMGNK